MEEEEKRRDRTDRARPTYVEAWVSASQVCDMLIRINVAIRETIAFVRGMSRLPLTSVNTDDWQE